MQDSRSEPQDWIIRIDQLQKQLDDFLSHLSSTKRPRAVATTSWYPSIDIHETTDAVIIIAEVAGIAAELIEASVIGDKIVISGRRDPHPTVSQSRAHQLEIGSGQFFRLLDLPSPVVGTRAKAFLNSGLLEIILPKTDQLKKDSIEITIRRASNRDRR
jgi:HSP20 family protein